MQSEHHRQENVFEANMRHASVQRQLKSTPTIEQHQIKVQTNSRASTRTRGTQYNAWTDAPQSMLARQNFRKKSTEANKEKKRDYQCNCYPTIRAATNASTAAVVTTQHAPQESTGLLNRKLQPCKTSFHRQREHTAKFTSTGATTAPLNSEQYVHISPQQLHTVPAATTEPGSPQQA